MYWIIGANDVAKFMAPVLCAKSITICQAVFIGSHLTHTICKLFDFGTKK